MMMFGLKEQKGVIHFQAYKISLNSPVCLTEHAKLLGNMKAIKPL